MKDLITNQAVVEALLFASESGISLDELFKFFDLSEPDQHVLLSDVENILSEITNKYQQNECGFELVFTGGKYRFLSKKLYHPHIQKMQMQNVQKSLSQAAMETLAIIAYKQPCVKSEIESIRGVSCDYSIDKLLEKNLIVITGQSDTPGKPLIYATSSLFTDYLAINSLNDLPPVKEFILPDTNFDG